MNFTTGAHKILNGFVNLAKTKTAKQTGILYGSQIMVMVFGLIITPILTRTLGPEKYGILVFILAVIDFIALFFEFGFFSAGARLLAVSSGKKEDQELIGALTIVTIGISLSFSLSLFIFSFFIDSIFHTSAGQILRNISILAAIFPFQYMLQQICQGANEIKKMAIANVAPKLWYLAGLLIVISFFKLDVFLAMVLHLTGIIVTTSLIIRSLKPGFNNLKENFKTIWKETKEYGLHVYSGRVVSVSANQLDRIFISYFINTLWVGFYNLVIVLITPMVLFSQVFSTSLFKGFASKEKIPSKVIFFNFLWLTAYVIGLIFLGKFIVIFLFSDKYLATTPLILPLALAGFFRGMYQPYNMFLGAHRKGEWLRNIAWMIGAINLVAYLVFIPKWGAEGAAIASAISMGIAMCIYVYYYRKYLKESEINYFKIRRK